MSRRPILLGLLLLGIIGFGLVITADESPALLERVTTIDGVEVDVPVGWEPSEVVPFEYRPPEEANRLTDRWLVAWSCAGECEVRSLADWRTLGETLPTFVNARDVAGELLFDLTESTDDRSRVVSARTQAGEVQVFVAVFFDGSDHYVECGLSVFDDVEGLTDAIVDACRDARPPG